MILNQSFLGLNLINVEMLAKDLDCPNETFTSNISQVENHSGRNMIDFRKCKNLPFLSSSFGDSYEDDDVGDTDHVLDDDDDYDDDDDVPLSRLRYQMQVVKTVKWE